MAGKALDNNKKRENNAEINIVEELSKQYFDGNFGCMPKAEIDLLMFAYFFKKLRDENPDNPSAYSNYNISEKLGITEGRVASLKTRTELKYPYLDDWKEQFAKLLPNVRLSEGDVVLHIPDKNILLKVKNAIEEAGGYIKISLNGNLLQVRKKMFMSAILSIVGNDSKEYQSFAVGISKIECFDDFAECSIAEVLTKDKTATVCAVAKEFLPVLLKCLPLEKLANKVIDEAMEKLQKKKEN